MSSDSTTDLNIGLDSSHATMRRVVHHLDGRITIGGHKQFFTGITMATAHSAEAQLEGQMRSWAAKCITHNKFIHRHGTRPNVRPRHIFKKVKGLNTDHAPDQKKLRRGWRDVKLRASIEGLGESFLETIPLEVQEIVFADEKAAFIAAVGGPAQWDALGDDECETRADSARTETLYRIGTTIFDSLPKATQDTIRRLAWAGCCMHKEMNALKGGCAVMGEVYVEKGFTPPVFLMNKDNEAALKLGGAESAPGKRALSVSKGGAIKLLELAGAMLRNKDTKKGQQDVHAWYFEYFATTVRQCQPRRFPNISSTRYGTFGTGAEEIITNLELYRDFLQWVKNAKAVPGWNHMEANIAKGLDDVPTITELVAIVLYTMAISHPYAAAVRGPGMEGQNALDLGPLHEDVKEHVQNIIDNPDLLLSPKTLSENGTFDGTPWFNPTALTAAHKLIPDLPNIREVFVALCTGALETWKRFTSEFESGNTDCDVESMTPEEILESFMPPTNCANEGSLGTYRVWARRFPSLSLAKFNAIMMVKWNETEDYIAFAMTEEDRVSLAAQARELEAGGANRAARKAHINEMRLRVEAAVAKAAVKGAKKDSEKARIGGITLILDVDMITSQFTGVRCVEQMEGHRLLALDPLVLGKSNFGKLKVAEKRVELRRAISACVAREEAALDIEREDEAELDTEREDNT